MITAHNNHREARRAHHSASVVYYLTKKVFFFGLSRTFFFFGSSVRSQHFHPSISVLLFRGRPAAAIFANKSVETPSMPCSFRRRQALFPGLCRSSLSSCCPAMHVRVSIVHVHHHKYNKDTMGKEYYTRVVLHSSIFFSN
jgi:hypothetical protein